VVLPVSDVDRARNFYQALGWQLEDVERPAVPGEEGTVRAASDAAGIICDPAAEPGEL
jgi:predicted enzyme related to lactoylglutathione lyase